MNLKPSAIALVLIFQTMALIGTAAALDSLEGTWSAPSLSQREVPIIFALLPDGIATEQIGTYHGTGTWQREGDSVRILWDSGWIGLLRQTANGSHELLTWKKETPTSGPPDDRQAAKPVSPANPR